MPRCAEMLTTLTGKVTTLVTGLVFQTGHLRPSFSRLKQVTFLNVKSNFQIDTLHLSFSVCASVPSVCAKHNHKSTTSEKNPVHVSAP